MYLNFYGLREKPFSLTPDTRFFYLSKNHQDAINHLIYGVREKEGFVALTGEIGTGKTTIIRSLIERLEKDANTALVINPLLEGDDLLRYILDEYGVRSTGGNRKKLFDRLNTFLLKEYAKGKKAVEGRKERIR